MSNVTTDFCSWLCNSWKENSAIGLQVSQSHQMSKIASQVSFNLPLRVSPHQSPSTNDKVRTSFVDNVIRDDIVNDNETPGNDHSLVDSEQIEPKQQENLLSDKLDKVDPPLPDNKTIGGINLENASGSTLHNHTHKSHHVKTTGTELAKTDHNDEEGKMRSMKNLYHDSMPSPGAKPQPQHVQQPDNGLNCHRRTTLALLIANFLPFGFLGWHYLNPSEDSSSVHWHCCAAGYNMTNSG